MLALTPSAGKIELSTIDRQVQRTTDECRLLRIIVSVLSKWQGLSIMMRSGGLNRQGFGFRCSPISPHVLHSSDWDPIGEDLGR